MTNTANHTAVVYLAWMPVGIEHFSRFLESYVTYNAGCPHQLVIAFNGITEKYTDGPDAYLQLLTMKGIADYTCFYYDKGQDIEIYRKIANELQSEYILFFNTYAVILANNWLINYVKNFGDNTGIVGATGSFQSYYSTVFSQYSLRPEYKKGMGFNFKKYKLFLKAFIYWQTLFKRFPNPHIRTNAFMVNRRQFISFKSAPVVSKFQAYLFESGRHGLSQFYLKKGLSLLVVDRNGKAYSLPDWKKSSTFWIGEQENLMVADNQTREYSDGTLAKREMLEKLAWGK